MPAPFSIIRDTDPSPPRGGVIAIGNFDGVHLGHRTVIDAAIAMAKASGKPAYAVTFEPHPRSFFQPNVPQFRLSSERDKLRLLAATGLDGAVVMGFDAKRAATSAVEFITSELVGRLGVSGIAVGYDFHFGKGRAGSPTLLQSEGARLHIPVHVEKRHETNGVTVSSGSIRDALNQGHVDRAAMMLGSPWFVSGEVRHGDKRGRDLGYPTANLALDPGCGLRHGIYAVRVGIGGKLVDGVASFGTRPMFDNGAPLLEVHLFDYAGDLYGAMLDVAFIGFLRDEMKLASVEALMAQMDADSQAARAVLGAAPGAFPALGEIGPG